MAPAARVSIRSSPKSGQLTSDALGIETFADESTSIDTSAASAASALPLTFASLAGLSTEGEATRDVAGSFFAAASAAFKLFSFSTDIRSSCSSADCKICACSTGRTICQQMGGAISYMQPSSRMEGRMRFSYCVIDCTLGLVRKSRYWRRTPWICGEGQSLKA